MTRARLAIILWLVGVLTAFVGFLGAYNLPADQDRSIFGPNSWWDWLGILGLIIAGITGWMMLWGRGLFRTHDRDDV